MQDSVSYVISVSCITVIKQAKDKTEYFPIVIGVKLLRFRNCSGSLSPIGTGASSLGGEGTNPVGKGLAPFHRSHQRLCLYRDTRFGWWWRGARPLPTLAPDRRFYAFVGANGASPVPTGEEGRISHLNSYDPCNKTACSRRL